jgi:YVTN family beta-propeller protein
MCLRFPVSVSAQSYVNFEGKQTSPIRLSPDATRLFAVNTPDARLSVFDVTQPSNPRLLAEIPVGVEPVSVNPRNNDEVWVVNEVSDSISIVSVSQRIVTDTLYVKDEPVDVVFAGSKAFVSASRKNLIAVFDVATHSLVTNITLFGENPRCLAVNTNGTKLYAAFALSGNHTTIIPGDIAPLQTTNGTPPMSPSLPLPPQVSLIVDATNATWFTDSPRTNVIKYTMPDNDVVEIDVATFAINRYFSRVGTVNLGLAIQPGSGDLFVANTDARNVVHFEPAVRSHTVDNRVSRINVGSGAVTVFDLNSNIDYNLLPNLPAKTNALAQPTAIVFDPSGSFFYVAAFCSDRVAKVDSNGTVLARIEICPTAIGSAADTRNKRGPRGLALNAAGQRLYVMNRIANTISIVDTTGNTVLKEIPVGSHDPTTTAIRQGRGFLYDAKLSGNGTMACAACHIDSEMDLIAWDLGDPTGQMVTNTLTLPPIPLTGQGTNHPMKGPMTTQTLRGLNTLDPFHWRGDRTNFTHFNIAFPGLLGGSALSTGDINAYRDFINTVTFQPNPNQNLDRTYSTNFAGRNAEAGRIAFFNTNYTGSGPTALQCNSCHSGPPGPGSDRLIIPGVAKDEPSNPSVGPQNFKTPHLRNAYQKLNFNNGTNAASIGGFGFVHDGTDPSVFAFLGRNVFANIRNNPTTKSNLAAFVESFDTGTAPAVGYSRTVVLTNVTTTSISNDWSLLESQANVTNIDLIVKGTIDGVRRGLVYQRASGNYRPDSTNLSTFIHAQLITKIQSGDKLTFMGVPPGSGTRMGIDRDEDGVLDGDVPAPTLHFTRNGNTVILNWPYAAAGYALESSDTLPATSWTNVPDPLQIIGDQNCVTNAIGSGAKFYRLHLP